MLSELGHEGLVTDLQEVRRPLPVEEYLRPQKRFAHLFSPQPRKQVLAQIQAMADHNIRKYDLLQERAR